jgi:hypothetical protein
LETLVQQGECEGLYLECKAPAAPQFTRDLKAELAVSISGFANSGGGVIIWGMRTTRNGELDVLTQATPIGAVKFFRQQVEDVLPRLAYPNPTGVELRTIQAEEGSSRGAVVAMIPGTEGDPVQSLIDRKFWLRTGSSFSEMPYEVVKRMFLGATGPDLVASLRSDTFTVQPDGVWRLPITIHNNSSAIAEHLYCQVEVADADQLSVSSEGTWQDVSSLNPGRCIFQLSSSMPLHRGIGMLFGAIRVKPLRDAVSCVVGVGMYANRMRARRYDFRVTRKGDTFEVEALGDAFLY